MKPKTFSETMRQPKNGDDNPLTATSTAPSLIETLPSQSLLGAEPETETEIEEIQGLQFIKPGEADKEQYNELSTETESEFSANREEPGTEAAMEEGEVALARDSFFASYPELLERSRSEALVGTDDRVRITPTTSFPWSGVCKLVIVAADNTIHFGTGFLVAPRTVVTAGHCVYLHAHGGWAKRIEVIPGLDDIKRPYGSYVGISFRSVVGWVRNRRNEYDYGAIILPRNSRPGDKTGSFGFAVKDDSYLKKAFLNISGYPLDKGGNQQWFMARNVKAVAPRLIYYELDTNRGMTGAPVWININKTTRLVVGIHTNGLISPNSATRIVQPVFNNIQAWKNQGM